MMRVLTGSMAASLLIAGTTLLGAVPAFAGADDGQTKAFWSSEAAPAPQASDRNSRYTASYRQPYMQIEPRDMKVDPNATQGVEGDNVFFNHAKGTMSGGQVQAQQTGDQNSRYTASYRQPYMQMDPRDAKVDSSAVTDVDGSNVYFNHAKGTMSGN